MRRTLHTRLLAAVVACTLAGASMPLMAAVYKCEQNGKATYSESPCGTNQKVLKQPQLVVAPAAQPAAAPAKQSTTTNGVLKWLGLDSQSGIVAALLFGIPLSIIFIFFLTRKSE